MKRSRFTEEQIIAILKEAEAGAEIGALSRRLPHVLCFLLFPDSFEPIVSRGHKEGIVAAFTDPAAEYGSRTELDEAVLQVREAMSEEYGEDLDFYAEDIEKQWRPSKYAKQEELSEPTAASLRSGFWIEKTIVDGRPDRQAGGHALGKALWSPVKDKKGADTYRFMRDVQPGDVILHLTDNQAFTGASRAAASYEIP